MCRGGDVEQPPSRRPVTWRGCAGEGPSQLLSQGVQGSRALQWPCAPVGGTRVGAPPRGQPGLSLGSWRCPSGALWAGGASPSPALLSSLESWAFQAAAQVVGSGSLPAWLLAAVCGLSEFLRLCPNKNNKVVNERT